MRYGVICGRFNIPRDQLRNLLKHARMMCEQLVVGIEVGPDHEAFLRHKAVVDEYYGAAVSVIFVYHNEDDLRASLECGDCIPHLRFLESSWQGREAPCEDLAAVNHYLPHHLVATAREEEALAAA
jgi:hypothetical protein